MNGDRRPRAPCHYPDPMLGDGAGTSRPAPARRGWTEAGGTAVLLAVALGLAVGLDRRDAPTVRWLVVSAIAVGVVAMVAAGRGRQRQRSGEWVVGIARQVTGRGRRSRGEVVGAVGWLILVAGFAAWDGLSFAAGRPGLPTLSREVGILTATGAGRGVLAAAWVAWGAWIVLGRRRPAP